MLSVSRTAGLKCSPGSFPEEHNLHTVEKNKQVEKHGQILDVIQVVLKLFQRVLDTASIAISHLGPSGDPWLDRKALAIEGDLLPQRVDEHRSLGSGADEAHLSDQHVEDRK